MFHLITHNVSVYRLTRNGGKEEYAATPIATGIDCGIVPASNDILAVYPGEAAYSLHEVFIYEPVGFKLGDKLVSGSEEYILRGVPQVYDNQYIYTQHLICEKVV